MLGKLAALAHSKVAVAVLGVVLVGGSGGAVAAAAATGHLSTLGVNLSAKGASSDTSHGDSSDNTHAHTVNIEGLLTACNTSATPKTISVKDSAGKTWTIVVSATTKINGDTQTNGASNSASNGAGAGGSSHASDSNGAGASSAKGSNSAHAGDNGDNGDNTGAGASSAKGDNSAHAGDNSAHADGNSAHTAPTLAAVCVAANIGSRDVQVQATQNGSTYDAWKVTLQGPGSANGGSDGSNGSNSSKPGAGDASDH